MSFRTFIFCDHGPGPIGPMPKSYPDPLTMDDGHIRYIVPHINSSNLQTN